MITFTESNPSQVAAGTNARHEGLHSFSAPISLKPTDKPSASGAAGGGTVNASAIPDEDGCTYDEKGKPTCTVQSEGAKEAMIDMRLPGLSAENEGNLPQIKERFKTSDERFQPAIDAVQDILSAKNDCSGFFGEFGLKALEMLAGRMVSGNPEGIEAKSKGLGIRMYSPTVGQSNIGERTAVFRVYDRVIVNDSGPFFPGSDTRIGGYPAGSIQSQVLQLLHELAHMIYKKGTSEPLIKDDGNETKEGLSKNNTNLIKDTKCKVELKNLEKSKK